MLDVLQNENLMENYQFIKQIGQGSYGEVWLVKCSKTRKKHVLKRIDLQQASKREQRAAHLEAKLLSTIKHPNIVTYLDSFHNSSGSLYIVMNYCECGDLYTYIKNQNGVHFEEKLIVHWFVQICLALKYLHDRNILHRNLKTRNIFLTKNNIIKVGDLGISRVLSIAHEMTATLIETPYYISPEIFAGKPYNEKSDIWALGCCTYEITTLKHPFIAQDIHSLIKKIMKRKLPSIPEIYSYELFDLITSMLSHESEDRPCVTRLLLNDYIRRYILLILQDSSKSPDSQYSGNSSVLSLERSKSNSDLSLLDPASKLNDIQRSVSTCMLSKNTSKSFKEYDPITKKKGSSTQAMIISVPDVNGNGDGNDNSQHGRLVNAEMAVHLSQKLDYATDVDKIVSQYSTKFDSNAKKSVKPKANAVPVVSSYNGIKNVENTNAIDQKMKSEISFQILNNLAYSLHTARQENYIDNNSYMSNGSFESPRITTIPPKSSEDHSTDRYSKFNTKKHTKNETDSDKTTSKGKRQSNVCTLPQIKIETQNKKLPKSDNHTKNLPCVKSGSSSSSEYQVNRNKPYTLKTPGNKKDNSILKKHVKNNKQADVVKCV